MQNANSKRAMSKDRAIENEIARHRKIMMDIDTLAANGIIPYVNVYARMMSVTGQAGAKISAMQQIPHWCFRKNRPELEPRLYNRWLKSQAKAGVRVIAGK